MSDLGLRKGVCYAMPLLGHRMIRLLMDILGPRVAVDLFQLSLADAGILFFTNRVFDIAAGLLIIFCPSLMVGSSTHCLFWQAGSIIGMLGGFLIIFAGGAYGGEGMRSLWVPAVGQAVHGFASSLYLIPFQAVLYQFDAGIRQKVILAREAMQALSMMIPGIISLWFEGFRITDTDSGIMAVLGGAIAFLSFAVGFPVLHRLVKVEMTGLGTTVNDLVDVLATKSAILMPLFSAYVVGFTIFALVGFTASLVVTVIAVLPLSLFSVFFLGITLGGASRVVYKGKMKGSATSMYRRSCIVGIVFLIVLALRVMYSSPTSPLLGRLAALGVGCVIVGWCCTDFLTVPHSILMGVFAALRGQGETAIDFAIPVMAVFETFQKLLTAVVVLGFGVLLDNLGALHPGSQNARLSLAAPLFGAAASLMAMGIWAMHRVGAALRHRGLPDEGWSVRMSRFLTRVMTLKEGSAKSDTMFMDMLFAIRSGSMMVGRLTVLRSTMRLPNVKGRLRRLDGVPVADRLKALARSFLDIWTAHIASQDISHPGKVRLSTGFVRKLIWTNTEALAARLDLITRAKERITFITWSLHGNAAIQIADALIAQHASGIHVKVFLDYINLFYEVGDARAIGTTSLGLEQVVRLQTAGVRCMLVMSQGRKQGGPPTAMLVGSHRKLLCVDGTQMLCGGRNSSDTYLGKADSFHFVDCEVILEGACVKDMEEMVCATLHHTEIPLDDLNEIYDMAGLSTGRARIVAGTCSDRKWPADKAEVVSENLEPQGPPFSISPVSLTERSDQALHAMVPVVDSNMDVSPAVAQGSQYECAVDDCGLRFDPPNASMDVEILLIDHEAQAHGFDSILSALIFFIDNAEHSVHIVMGYIMLVDELFDAIKRACERGIRVHVFTNSVENQDIYCMKHAFNLALRILLQIGACIYICKPVCLGQAGVPAVLHMKCAVVDRAIVLVGSWNAWPQSIFFDAEASVFIFSEIWGETFLTYIEQTYIDSQKFVPLTVLHPENVSLSFKLAVFFVAGFKHYRHVLRYLTGGNDNTRLTPTLVLS